LKKNRTTHYNIMMKKKDKKRTNKEEGEREKGQV
jgi:hypothetical protein